LEDVHIIKLIWWMSILLEQSLCSLRSKSAYEE